MTQLGTRILLLAAALSMGLVGCEDSVRRAVQVRPPQSAAPAPQVRISPLPLDTARSRAARLLIPPARPDGVDRLAAWADAVYQAGLGEYNAGHPGRALNDFNSVLQALSASGFDLQADEKLNRIYTRILETAHAYELAARDDPSFFAEPPTVPAPIDQIADLELTPEPSLREETKGELARVPHDLPVTLNDTVLTYLNFFRSTRGRAIVEGGLKRAGRYQDMIKRVFREEGLPQDLMYLAQAESGFQPMALSRAGARGIWQFMSWRAREYGLQKNWWIDERQDPEKSTRAAARHLHDLYNEFGDWYLAMAAYDCGPGNVSKGIERTGYADFWELYRRNVLPKETKNYVPIILAFMLAAKNAPQFGIEVQPETPLNADVVKPGHPVDLRLVAETLDVDVEVLRALNPALLHLVTPADPQFELLLPAGTSERFQTEIAEAIPPEKWVSWRRYRVEEGETLSQLARKFKLSPSAIAQANGMDGDARLEPGLKVIIPAAERPQTATGKLVRYRMHKGDTLQSVADEFDVSVAELKRWNGLRRDHVAPGARLKIYPGGRSAPPGQEKSARQSQAVATIRAGHTAGGPAGEPVVHRVKEGETLWSIAHAYQTTVDALKRANRFLASRPLQAGDQLMVFPRR